MKDTSRDAIRQVLKPSMYPLMLTTNTGICLCSDCVANHAHSLIQDLRNGYYESYGVLSLCETDSWFYCEHCEQRFSSYEDLSND